MSCLIASTKSSCYWTTDGSPDRELPADMLAALWSGKRGPRLSGIVVRTAEAIEVGGYRPRHGDLCDIGLWAAVALKHPYIVCVNEPLVQYTNHHGSTTSKSAVKQWQDWMFVVRCDLLAVADPASRRTLQAGKRDFLSGITLTILMQTIGKSGWIGNGIREAIRSPRGRF